MTWTIAIVVPAALGACWYIASRLALGPTPGGSARQLRRRYRRQRADLRAVLGRRGR